MQIDIFVHVINDSITQITQRLDTITAQLTSIQQRETIMAGELSALTAQVQRNTDVEQSAIVLIQGIAAQLAAAKTDPVKIQALADQLNASATDLAAAVAANTPAA